LLTPATRKSSAWVFSSTYGGGLLGGDSIRLNIHAGDETTTLLSTQASTKIYRTEGSPSSQELNVTIGQSAVFVSAPDPVVCFKSSEFVQQQKFMLAPTATLVALDWFSSGRWANGERWAFQRYETQNEIFVRDRCIFRDCLALDPADGAVGNMIRMGLVNCYATVVVVGVAASDSSAKLLDQLSKEPVDRNQSLLFSASPIENGAVLRVAGSSCEIVGAWIREKLGFVTDLIGHDPWARKW
jgi:urease accessory protein